MREHDYDLDALEARVPARRLADIPPEVREALSEGLIETASLVEWLAVDVGRLLATVLADLGVGMAAGKLAAEWAPLAEQGITRRVRGAAHIISRRLAGRADREKLLFLLAAHPADMGRAFACYALAGGEGLSLGDLLRRVAMFADDDNMTVRECAWDALRPHLAAQLPEAIELLVPWVHDPSPNIRRCAIEGTRPRGVWTAHIAELKADPSLGLPLLEPVRADASRFVQDAVGNWLNDASKSRPDFVAALCERWCAESPTPATGYIVRRALRTLHRAGGAAT